MVVAPQFQMRGLETVPVTRRDGRGPDSSLKKSMDIPVHISLPYGQSLNVYVRVISTATNIVASHFTAKKITIRNLMQASRQRLDVPLDHSFPTTSFSGWPRYDVAGHNWPSLSESIQRDPAIVGGEQ